ncbi:hypothetical protein LBMAG49_16190 [Planctomycetota bacterium]|jgi:hypothetical protein|nr:hypothetical protein [Planctomycetota bacterium]GDY02290.1 hypothetical protein LBMAG49_16190 [Planctomycetota bacterium]
MHLAAALGTSLILAALCATLTDRAVAPGVAAATLPAQGSEAANGHLILIVQGNVQQLTITHAVAKADPFAGAPKGLQSRFAVRLLGDKDQELLSVPIDLSRFDTDKSHIGKPKRVQECEIWSSAIALSVNVPRIEAVRRYEFTCDGLPIGSTNAATVLRQIGEVR